MSSVHTFSTVLRDGEELTKINTWLNKYRCDELVRFHAERVNSISSKIILETQNSKRFKILSSWPPHQSYMMTGKAVPYIDITFSEPVDLGSCSGEVTLNGITISDANMSLMDNDYTLRIDTTGFTMTAAGQYELILGTGVLHADGLWKLCGERKVLWSTSDHGGSRGGEDIYEKDKSRITMAKVISENQHSEKKMLQEFYATYMVDPDDVVATQFNTAYPEYDRTVLYVIYKMGKVPYVKCANPEYKACLFQDGSPDEVTVEIGLTEEIVEESLSGNIYVDGSAVADADWDLTQDGKLLTVRFTPAEYKHHVVKITEMQSGQFTRTWPYAHSFVIHKVASGGAVCYEDITIWEDCGIQNDGVKIDGYDTIVSTPTITTVGTSNRDLNILPESHANVRFFESATSGQNPFIIVTGYNAVDGQQDTWMLNVDTGGNSKYDATGCHVFDTPAGTQFIVQKDGAVQLEPQTITPPPCPAGGGGLYSDGDKFYFGKVIT